MLGLLSLTLAQAAVGMASPPVDHPSTRIERLLDRADDAIATAGQFSCAASRQDQQETQVLRARYDRVFAVLERRLGREPYRASFVADCAVLDRTDYWEAMHRASASLNEVERMLGQGRAD